MYSLTKGLELRVAEGGGGAVGDPLAVRGALVEARNGERVKPFVFIRVHIPPVFVHRADHLVGAAVGQAGGGAGAVGVVGAGGLRTRAGEGGELPFGAFGEARFA